MKQLSIETKSKLDYIKSLVEATCRYEISSKKSTIPYVFAKRLFLYLVDFVFRITEKRNLSLSYGQLAEYIGYGYTNHACIYNLFKNREQYLRTGTEMKTDYDYLLTKIANMTNVANRINYLNTLKLNLIKEISFKRKHLNEVFTELDKLKITFYEKSPKEDKTKESLCC